MPSERVQRRIDKLLDQAEEAADKRDWSVVLECVASVLAIDETDQDALSFRQMAQAGAAQNPAFESSESANPLTPVEINSAPAQTPESASSSDQPTSFAGGRYTVERFLGEGGKKRVFLAHDVTLDRDVAFALIKTDGLDDIGRERVRREAQAMGRMGTHPCIMPIYDLGDEAGQPFMVQPVMGGGDVEGLIEDADGPLELETAIRIATQTAQGLVFAHSKGIVHRDLKPGNVWLDEDGAAKIGDFGLAVATDRSRLTVEKVMVGTVNYMPPEQATGSELTPRADLYSLGAMLYEMCTGRVPFMGDDEIAVISQHVNTPPVAPSWHNSAIPKTLDALILRMMAKDPAERPESADEVLTALSSIDLSVLEESGEEKTGSLDSMAGGVFVGRQREMDQLKSVFEEVLSGRGRTVALVGQAGIGKTRSAQELATYATIRGAQVLWGRCYDEKGAPPYCPWLQAIWECARVLEPGDLRTLLGAGAPEIADAVPYIRERLPDLPEAPFLEPAHARYRFFNSVGQFLNRATLDQPRVIVLDDVHWADESSLSLLAHIQPVVAANRLMVVMAYRDDELSLRHPLSRALAELQKHQSFNRLWVRGLNHGAVARFIEMASGSAAPSTLSLAVHKQTEGNPLFMTEVVRMLVEKGDIGPDHVADRNSWTISIPEGVRVVVGTRLSRLSAETDDLLAAAAVIGREFDIGLLTDLITNSTPLPGGESPAMVVTEAIESAVKARVIEEDGRAAGLYRFTHSLIRQTLLEDLSSIRRMQLHADVATAMERRDGPGGPDAIAIAGHLGDAGPTADAARLISYCLEAGHILLERFAYEEAETVFQRAIDARHGRELDDDAARLWVGLGRAQAAALDSGAAIESLARAFEYYVDSGQITSAVEVACSPVGPGQTGIKDLVARALELVDPESHDAGHLLSHHGFFLGAVNDYDGAMAALNKAVEIARRVGDRALEMWTLTRIGHVEIYLHDLDRCIEKDGQALLINQEVKDPHLEAYAGMCLAFSFLGKGDVSGARNECGTMLEVAENARHRRGMITALEIHTLLQLWEGDWDGTRSYLDKCLDLNPMAVNSLAYRVFVEFLIGNATEMESCLSNLLTALDEGAPVWTVPQYVLAEIGEQLDRPRLLEIAKTAAANQISNGVQGTMADPIAALALVAIAESDATGARNHYAALSKLPDSCSTLHHLNLHRLLGRLALTSGDENLATGHLDDAVEFSHSFGYRPDLAWCCSDYSELLLERNEPGDREKAIELQDEAISIATELGMKPLLERVLAKRDILKA